MTYYFKINPTISIHVVTDYHYFTTVGGRFKMYSSQLGEVFIKQGSEGEIFDSK